MQQTTHRLAWQVAPCSQTCDSDARPQGLTAVVDDSGARAWGRGALALAGAAKLCVRLLMRSGNQAIN